MVIQTIVFFVSIEFLFLFALALVAAATPRPERICIRGSRTLDLTPVFAADLESLQ